MKARPWCVWVVNISQASLQLWASVSMALHSPRPPEPQAFPQPPGTEPTSGSLKPSLSACTLLVSITEMLEAGPVIRRGHRHTQRWVDKGCLPGDGSQRELSPHRDVSAPGGGIPIVSGSISRAHPSGKSQDK